MPATKKRWWLAVGVMSSGWGSLLLAQSPAQLGSPVVPIMDVPSAMAGRISEPGDPLELRRRRTTSVATPGSLSVSGIEASSLQPAVPTSTTVQTVSPTAYARPTLMPPTVPSLEMAREQPALPPPQIELSTVAGTDRQDEHREQLNYARDQLHRSAVMSARSVVLRVLQQLSLERSEALANDRPQRALEAGMTAMREAEDFLGRYGALDTPGLQRLVETHQTRVLKNRDLRGLTPHSAADAYFDAARQLVMGAIGGGPLGADALQLLSQTYLHPEAPTGTTNRAIAITCLRAAVAIHPVDGDLANELGYQLLVDGRYEEAGQLLQHSLSCQPTAAAYQNLAELNRRTGNLDAARSYASQAIALSPQTPPTRDLVVFSPEQFASISPPPTNQSAAPAVYAVPASYGSTPQGMVPGTMLPQGSRMAPAMAQQPAMPMNGQAMYPGNSVYQGAPTTNPQTASFWQKWFR